MKCITFSLVITIICNGNKFESFDWENINLLAQISKDFILSESEVEYRNINGTNNNPSNPLYGSRLSAAPRCLPPAYGDKFNSLSGENRPNERIISNTLSDQIPENDPKFINSRDLTQFAWQWGQFIDHDITLIPEDRNSEDVDIPISSTDPYFDDAFMDVFRTNPFGTGTSSSDIRKQFNEVTSFIDGSGIYGSDEKRALTLRTLKNGKLKQTDDGLLPKNIDGLPNEPNTDSRFFIAGDVRSNEQLGLTVMHTLWVRAHNMLSELVADSIDTQKLCSRNDECFDETVYQVTKLIITAIIEKITYQDWLPTLFGPTAINRFLGEYTGYDDGINPGICPIFASAGYRLGHTFVPFGLPLRDEECEAFEFEDMINNCPFCDDGLIQLKNAFFIPEILDNNDEFLDAVLYGYACTLANEVDVFISGGLRNFLFFSAVDASGQMIFGELDLIAINILRGREHGLPDYNSVRAGLKLTARDDFSDITSDSEIAAKFRQLYTDINDVDLFLAALAEDHFSDGSFGETTSAIVLEQFKKLRRGDRFYFETYLKEGALRDLIESITLKDIIELTADIKFENIGDNIFQNTGAVSIFDDIDSNSFDSNSFDSNSFDGYTEKRSKIIKKTKIIKRYGIRSKSSSDSVDNARSIFDDKETKEDMNMKSGNTYELIVDLSNNILYNVWGIIGVILFINFVLFWFCWKQKK